PASAWRRTSSLSSMRPQSSYGHFASPPVMVLSLWSLTVVTISKLHLFRTLLGSRRTPVPLGANRQLGERGINPSQYGHVMVRAQRYVRSTPSAIGLGGKRAARRPST